MRLLAAIAALGLRLLGATWQVRITGHDPFEAGDHPVLGALLHRDFLVAAWHYRDRGIHVGVSRSRDGDRITAVLRKLGYGEPARGSSSSGGALAQIRLLRVLDANEHVAVVVDGPRGPAGIPKPGIAQLARESGRPITPVTFHASRAIRFGSWDRAQLPLPFARVEVRYGEALMLADDGPRRPPDPGLAELARRLSA